MKVKYLGCAKRKTGSGCRSCGGATSYGYTMERMTRFVMTNGEIRQYVAGETYEVTQEEAGYLLNHTCAEVPIFKVVG